MGEHLVATGVRGNVSLQKAQGEALHEQTPVRRGQMLWGEVPTENVLLTPEIKTQNPFGSIFI